MSRGGLLHVGYTNASSFSASMVLRDGRAHLLAIVARRPGTPGESGPFSGPCSRLLAVAACTVGWKRRDFDDLREALHRDAVARATRGSD